MSRVDASFKPQSDEQQVTTHFNDDHTVEDSLQPTKFNMLSTDIVHPIQDLNDFLKRPISLGPLTWHTADPVGTSFSIYPWELFLQNAAIKKRIDNYSLLRGNLHIKMVITASPFWFGASRLIYRPCFNLRPPSATTGDGVDSLIPRSQLPGSWIYPQDNKGTEIILPFIYHKNWLNLQDADSSRDLGLLSMVIYAPLRNSNGIAAGSLDLEFYAWMDDVELAGPSVGWSLQSNVSGDSRQRSKKSMRTKFDAIKNARTFTGKSEMDAYSGPISSKASAVESFLGNLTSVPVVAPYALASRMIATGVKELSNLMGYTNTPNMRDVNAIMPKSFPNQATTDVSVPYEKLSVDTKQEVTIDSRTIGHNGKDELLLSNLLQHESYLTSFDFATTDVDTTLLFTTQIHPMHAKSYTIAGVNPVTAWNSIPAALLSQYFKYWRGSMIYRFKFICSKFHKGRVRISYDPYGEVANNLINTVETTNLAFTRVVDISSETDLEIEVPYMQSAYWLKSILFSDTSLSNAAPAFVVPGTTTNGTLTVRVLNSLSAPTATSTVTVLVSARCGDDFKFSNPLDINSKYKTWAPQSDVTTNEINETTKTEKLAPIGDTSADQCCLVTSGEEITSLRQLLHRSVYVDTITGRTPASTASNITNFRVIHGRLPPKRGYDVNGFYTALPTINIGNRAYNYCKDHLFNTVSEMFLCYRGSVNWGYQFRGEAISGVSIYNKVRASRYPGGRTASHNGQIFDLARTDYNVIASNHLAINATGSTGSSLCVPRSQGVSLINMPYYNRYNMMYSNHTNDRLGTDVDESYEDSMLVDCDTSSAAGSTGYKVFLDRYFCTGPDFNFMVFLNSPTIYQYDDPLPP